MTKELEATRRGKRALLMPVLKQIKTLQTQHEHVALHCPNTGEVRYPEVSGGSWLYLLVKIVRSNQAGAWNILGHGRTFNDNPTQYAIEWWGVK